jgi:hypothetical protein
VKGLIAVGFLDEIDGVYHVHGWRERQPFIVDQQARSEAARRSAHARWNSHANASAPSETHPDDVKRIRPASETHLECAKSTVPDAPILSDPSDLDRSGSDLDRETTCDARPAPKPLTDSLEKNERKQQSSRASRLPESFVLTPERRQYALTNGVHKPELEFEKFRDHFPCCARPVGRQAGLGSDLAELGPAGHKRRSWFCRSFARTASAASAAVCGDS